MTFGLMTALALVLSICLYAALIRELFLYLEKYHPRTWHELGEPWPWNSTPNNVWSSAKFIFFGDALRLWDDAQLRVRIIGVWISLAMAFAIIFLSKAVNP